MTLSFVIQPAMAQDDLGWIDAYNFKRIDGVQYSQDSDRYEDASNLFEKESLMGSDAVKLAKLSKEGDPISQMATLCYQDKFEEAFKVSDSVYDRYKTNTSYWNMVGSCYFLKGDFARALLFYNKSRDLNSKFAPAINNLGVLYFKQKKFQKAAMAFKKAVELGQFSVVPSFNLANIYLMFGQKDKGCPIIKGLYDKDSKNIGLKSRMATCLMLTNKVSDAIELFETFDKEQIKKADIGINYAVALKMSSRPKDAQSVWSNIEIPNPGLLKDYYSRAEKWVRD